MNARASLWVDLVASVLGAPERVRSHCLPKGESGGEPLRRYLAEPKLFPCPLQPRSSPFSLVGDLLVCAVKINFTARCRGGLFYVPIQYVKHIPLFLFRFSGSFLFCLRNIIQSFCLPSSFSSLSFGALRQPKATLPSHQSASMAVPFHSAPCCVCVLVSLLTRMSCSNIMHHALHAYQSVYISLPSLPGSRSGS